MEILEMDSYGWIGYIEGPIAQLVATTKYPPKCHVMFGSLLLSSSLPMW